MLEQPDFSVETLGVASLPEKECAVVLHEGILPALIWLDVPVQREVRTEITVVERFVLEASLVLQTFSIEDIVEITSLPRAALEGTLRRLVVVGAIALVSNGTYEARQAVAQDSLSKEVLIERKPDHLSFVFLPRTNDLLAFPKGHRQLLAMSRLNPGRSAPLPVTPGDDSKLATLQRGLESRTIVGLPPDVVAISGGDEGTGVTDSEQLPEVCPAFSCCGTVEEDGEELVAKLTVYGEAQKHRSGQESAKVESIQFDLRGADALFRIWTNVSAALQATEFQQKVSQALAVECLRGVEVKCVGPARWQFLLDEHTARHIALSRHSLVSPIALAVSAKEAIIEVYLQFCPVDEGAAQLFAVDWAVSRLDGSADATKAPDLALLLQEAMTHYRVARPIEFSVVAERIWKLGYYRLLYRLRQHEDFDYG